MSPQQENQIEKLVDQIIDFIKDNKRSARSWFNNKFMSVYVRKGLRNYDTPNAAHNLDSDWFHLDHALVPTLEIASVEVREPGQGIFTKFLQKIEEKSPLSFIYIENINNDRLYSFLKRRNYKVYSRPEELCLYKCV